MKFLKLSLALISLSFFVACGSDCDDDKCLNGGFAEDIAGSCVCDCPDGFSGEDCEIDECEALSCASFEKIPTENGCECDCEDGFEGENCATEIRTKYYNTYNVIEECDSTIGGGPNGEYKYESSFVSTPLSRGGTVVNFDISDLGDGLFGVPVTATVTSSFEFTLPENTNVNGIEILEGAGSIDIDTKVVTLNYSYKDEEFTDFCRVTFTPQ